MAAARAEQILMLSDRLEMVRVAAARVLAEMVEDQTSWYVSNASRVGQAMRKYSLAAKAE